MNYLHWIIIFFTLIIFVLMVYIFWNKNKNKQIKEVLQNNKKKLSELSSENLNLKQNNRMIIGRYRQKENELLLFQQESIKNFLNDNNRKETHFDSFFKRLERQFISNSNYRKALKFVFDKVEKGTQNNAKFIMTLEDFKSDNGWMIVMSLLACNQINDISNKEKQSWFANFGPLKALFYNENKKNFIKNTWLVFEKEVHWKSKNERAKETYFPLRPDLMLITKTADDYNIVILELKQWSEYWNNTNLESKKAKIKRQLEAYKKNTKIKARNYNIKIVALSFLFNLSKEQIRNFNQTDTGVIHFAAEDKVKLSQKIYMSLTNNKEVEEFDVDELSIILNILEDY